MTVLTLLSVGKSFIGVIDPDQEVAVTNWEDDAGTSCASADCAADIADDSDSTFIQNHEILMAFCGGSEEVRNCRFGFDNPDPSPTGEETVIVNLRARYQTPGGNGDTASVVVRIYEGASLEHTFSSQALTTSLVDYVFAFPEAVKNNIGDWDDIQIDLEITVCEIDGADMRCQFAKMEIEFD